ncbi:MAG: SDR family NAD(P)-dependent oxidoreductase [Akkermansiaceae bacterium]|nr:SDR family NAD(P)-dependent oxidoreductase [Akkermansiaceae bacterium]
MNILIIGSGAGLSRSTAHLFGEKGFSVSLVARNEEKLRKETALLQTKGITADYSIADISSGQTLKNVLSRFKQDNCLPEVVLFNAFANAAGGLAEETWDNLKKELDVNVGAAFNLLKELLPSYLQKKKGNLFFTGGGFGITPSPEYLGIGLGKAALRNLVQATAAQVKGTGIHVATVTVMGFIGGENPKYAPDKIAEVYWNLYNQQAGEFDVEIVY